MILFFITVQDLNNKRILIGCNYCNLSVDIKNIFERKECFSTSNTVLLQSYIHIPPP